MRILITNDDGIHAEGLAALEAIAAELSDDVVVVAPETDQSGKAHSMTLTEPLRVRRIDDRRYAVRGTPTDCVIMAVRHLFAVKPDLVLSGVNRGSNVADDVIYSGTVAGAMEGAILGLPSIALSQSYGWSAGDEASFDCARAHGPRVIQAILGAGIPDGTMMNVNFPNRAPAEVAGIEATMQGERRSDMIGVNERVDARGMPYYWIEYRPKRLSPGEGTDLRALQRGAISVTPLRLDLTDHSLRQRLAHALERPSDPR